mgnify:FL=1
MRVWSVQGREYSRDMGGVERGRDGKDGKEWKKEYLWVGKYTKGVLEGMCGKGLTVVEKSTRLHKEEGEIPITTEESTYTLVHSLTTPKSIRSTIFHPLADPPSLSSPSNTIIFLISPSTNTLQAIIHPTLSPSPVFNTLIPLIERYILGEQITIDRIDTDKYNQYLLEGRIKLILTLDTPTGKLLYWTGGTPHEKSLFTNVLLADLSTVISTEY